MKWTSFTIFAAFLLFTSTLVKAETPALPNGAMPDISTYSALPAGVTDVLSRTKPDQLSLLPLKAQQEAARLQAKAIASLREEVASRSPVAGGQVPSLSSPSSPASSSTTSNSALRTSNSPTYDPLGAINTSMTLTNSQASLSDYSTQDIAVKSGIREWVSYYDTTADNLDEAKLKYQQVKSAFTEIKQELQRMAAKMPVLIPNCTKV